MSILISYLCTKSTTLNKAFRQHHAYAVILYTVIQQTGCIKYLGGTCHSLSHCPLSSGNPGLTLWFWDQSSVGFRPSAASFLLQLSTTEAACWSYCQTAEWIWEWHWYCCKMINNLNTQMLWSFTQCKITTSEVDCTLWSLKGWLVFRLNIFILFGKKDKGHTIKQNCSAGSIGFEITIRLHI